MMSDNGTFGDAFDDSLWALTRGGARARRVGVESASMRRYDAVCDRQRDQLTRRRRAARDAQGWRVCVLERNDWLGGAIRTAEITEPGFLHEVFASWHPLFTGSAAYAELRSELEAAGSST